MLIRFSSIATESIIMLRETAMPLIHMMGASGSVPGAIYARDLPAALSRLRKGLHLKNSLQPALAVSDDDEPEQSALNLDVPLAIHALPLIDLVERASAARVPMMWEENKATI